MAFAIARGGAEPLYAARKAAREHKRQHAVQLRPTYPDIDESVAVAAALSTAPDAGSVGLSRKPVAGASDGEERAGLG